MNKTILTKNIARLIIDEHCTLRECGRRLGVSKTLCHRTIHAYLPTLNLDDYCEVCKIFKSNFKNKCYKGGQATKRKWSKK